jgi:transposase
MLPDGKLLVLVTGKNPDQALENYKKRWGIETLFQCLKKRGFNFEKTRMTLPERIDKLIALLAIAFAWCRITGEWRNEQRKIKIKKHGRKEISVFRYGLDYIPQILLNFSANWIKSQTIVRETLEGRFARNHKMELSR